MKKKTLLTLLYCISGCILLGVIILIIVWSKGRKQTPAPSPIPEALTEDPDVTVVYRDVNRMVEVEKTITASILEDGLQDMGFLVTQEYYFTEVVSFSSIKNLWGLDLNFTESSYMGTYDGVIAAGVDFEDIEIEKDDEKQIITVHIPSPTIQYIDIDPDSFVLYDEKTGIGNPVSVVDFNRSLSEMENNAENKAIEKGLLIAADDNAKRMIRNFISSLVDTSVYEVEFVTK